MVNETLVHLMSGRLKQQAYINNPDARNFLAEVATIILYILLNDGKYRQGTRGLGQDSYL